MAQVLTANITHRPKNIPNFNIKANCKAPFYEYPAQSQEFAKNCISASSASIPSYHQKKDSQNFSDSSYDTDDSLEHCKSSSTSVNGNSKSEQDFKFEEDSTSSSSIGEKTNSIQEQQQQKIRGTLSYFDTFRSRNCAQEIFSEEDDREMCSKKQIEQSRILRILNTSNTELKKITDVKQIEGAKSSCVEAMIKEGIYGEYKYENLQKIEDNYNIIQKVYNPLKTLKKKQLKMPKTDFVDFLSIQSNSNNNNQNQKHFEQGANFQPSINLLTFDMEKSKNQAQVQVQQQQIKVQPIEPKIDTKKINNRWNQCRSLQTRFFNHVC